MEKEARRQLRYCVWKAWTGAFPLQDMKALESGLRAIMEQATSGEACESPLREEIVVAFADTTFVSQRRAILLREVMQRCPAFQRVWIALYQKRYQAMYRYAYWLLSSEADAEDVVQSLFIETVAWVLLQECLLERELEWGAYLKTCVRRACLKRIGQKGPELLVDELTDWVQENDGAVERPDAWSVYRSLRGALETKLLEKWNAAKERQKSKEASIWSRRQKILEYLLRIPPLIQQEIAKKLGVSEATICMDNKCIGEVLLQILDEGEST